MGDQEEPSGIDEAKAIAAAASDDQALAGIVTYTVLLAAFFKGLIKEGFTRDEALALTIEYHRGLLSMQNG